MSTKKRKQRTAEVPVDIAEFLRREMPSITIAQECAEFKTRRGRVLLDALTDSTREVPNNVAAHILERAGGFGEVDQLGDAAILILAELLFTNCGMAEATSPSTTFRRWYQHATGGLVYDLHDDPLWTIDAAWPVFICMMRRIACTPDIAAACAAIHKELRRMSRAKNGLEYDHELHILCRNLLSALAKTDVVKRPLIDWDAAELTVK